MDINYKLFSDSFSVPRLVADTIKIAKGDFVKVIICIFSNPKDEISSQRISKACGIPVDICDDAIMFWKNAGVLSDSQNDLPIAEPPISLNIEKLEVFSSAIPKMTHSEYSKRLSSDEKMGFMIRKSEIYMGASINEDKAKTLIALHDFAGLDPDVILTVVAYCCSKGQKSIMAIKKEALSWANRNITTAEKAEEHLRYLERYDRAVAKVRSLFDIPAEKHLTQSEMDYAYEWIEAMGIPDELIKEAGKRSKKSYGTARFSAVNKCLNIWHGKGITTLSGVESSESTSLFSKKSSKMKYYQGFVSETPSLTEDDLNQKHDVPVYSRKERK